MKTIALLILLPVCLLACATASPPPSGNTVVYHPETPWLSSSSAPSDKNLVTVTWTLANIRSGLGNEYPVVKYVQQGDKLTVLGASGDWIYVRSESGRQGWISNRVVK